MPVPVNGVTEYQESANEDVHLELEKILKDEVLALSVKSITGTFGSIAILKYLKDNDIDFEHTEVIAMSAGSEEAGLRGAKAWCEAHAHEFNDVPTFVYSYDTITQPEYMQANYRDQA